MTQAFDKREGWIWMNGSFVPWEKATTHVISQGLHYASSVFEGERAYGGKIFKSKEHTKRLFKSANIIGMKIPFSEEEIIKARDVDITTLKDPQIDADRVQNAKYLVMVGVCTHLGCVPLGQQGEYGGWFCPCHGSHYDTSGRIRKGPAPTNLEVPPYVYLDESTIKIG